MKNGSSKKILFILLGIFCGFFLVSAILVYIFLPSDQENTQKTGSVDITLEIDRSALKDDDIQDIQKKSLEIIHNRINDYGLSRGATIIPVGEDRIQVHLSGIDDSTAKALVGSTAKLEIKILAETEMFDTTVNHINSILSNQPTEIGTSFQDYFLNFINGGFIAEENIEAVKRLLEREDIKKQIPSDVVFAFGSSLEKIDRNSLMAKRIFLLKRQAEMGGEDIVDAQAKNVFGNAGVNIRFGGIGTKKFSDVTAANINKQMAFVLDNQVITAPLIMDRISSGDAMITGTQNMDEAKLLAVLLRSGDFKAPMKIIETRLINN
jgi:SecD/SecF fusion protein